MKKRKSFLIITYSLVYYLLLLVSCTNGVEYNSNKLLASSLESKLEYYYPIIDSSQRENFKKIYSNSIARIATIEGEVKVVGERLIVSRDTIQIDFFILSKRKSEYFISMITALNDVASFKEYKRKIILPNLSLFCNVHYFYLPKSRFVSGRYNAYSILLTGKHVIHTKIFLSDKFDKYNNVVCPCDSTELDNMVDYINKSFKKKSLVAVSNYPMVIANNSYE